jgi:hypothetical protein
MPALRLIRQRRRHDALFSCRPGGAARRRPRRGPALPMPPPRPTQATPWAPAVAEARSLLVAHRLRADPANAIEPARVEPGNTPRAAHGPAPAAARRDRRLGPARQGSQCPLVLITHSAVWPAPLFGRTTPYAGCYAPNPPLRCEPSARTASSTKVFRPDVRKKYTFNSTGS